MRVLQVAAIPGSISKLLAAQVRGMLERGWDVHAACAVPNGPPAEPYGLSWHDVPFDRAGRLAPNLRALRVLRRLAARVRPDIVHFHMTVPAAVGRLAFRWGRRPHIVYTAHGYYFHDRMAPRRYRAHLALERFLCRATDLVLCQSDEDRATAVRERLIAPDRVVTIGNGVQVELFAEPQLREPEQIRATRESMQLDPQQPVVCTVARLARHKGILDFVRAAARVRRSQPHAQFAVVGAGLPGEPDDCECEARALAESLELGGSLVFTGQQLDVAPILAASDVFVLASYREGMPRSIIEAMAAGRPVVATNIRGSREEVVEGETGFVVEPGDVDALAERIGRLVDDPGLAARMGAAGQERASRLYREEDVVQRVCDALEAMVSDGQARREGEDA